MFYVLFFGLLWCRMFVIYSDWLLIARGSISNWKQYFTTLLRETLLFLARVRERTQLQLTYLSKFLLCDFALPRWLWLLFIADVLHIIGQQIAHHIGSELTKKSTMTSAKLSVWYRKRRHNLMSSVLIHVILSV